MRKVSKEEPPKKEDDQSLKGVLSKSMEEMQKRLGEDTLKEVSPVIEERDESEWDIGEEYEYSAGRGEKPERPPVVEPIFSEEQPTPEAGEPSKVESPEVEKPIGTRPSEDIPSPPKFEEPPAAEESLRDIMQKKMSERRKALKADKGGKRETKPTP